jgi:TRAP-type C4-dicarboxylate transport system substrate-binding protein
MKKLIISLLIICLIGSFIFISCSQPAATTTPAPTTTAAPTPTIAPMTLTFNGAQFGANDPPGRTYMWFCNTVTQRTNGAIKFNYVGSNSLTKPGEELTALQSGTADVSAFSTVYYPTQMFINSGFNRAVPFDITDIPTATKVIYKLYYDDPETSKILADEFTKQGVHFLTMTVDDSYVIESKAAINTLDDMKGKKLAVLGYEGKYFGPTGATVVGMPVGDRPTALQTGVLDGAATPFEISAPFKLYEFAPYMIQSGFGCVTGNAIAWNMNKWNSLPQNVQDIITQVAKDTFNQNAVIASDWYTGALAARAQSTGNKPYTNFSAADLAKWAGLVGEPVADWVKDAASKNLVGADTVVAKFIAGEKAAGYVFPKEWALK